MVVVRGRGAKNVLTEWIREQAKTGARTLFANRRGGRLSFDSVQYLVSKYVVLRNRRAPP